MKYLRMLLLAVFVLALVFTLSVQSTLADSHVDSDDSPDIVDDSDDADEDSDNPVEDDDSNDTDKPRDRMRDQREDFQERRDDMQQKRDEHKEDMEERREEHRARLADHLKKRIENVIHKIINRVEAAAERLRHIAGRITTRIEKIEENTDLDLSEASELVDQALAEVDLAVGKIPELQEAVHTAFDSDSPRDSFRGVVKVILEEIKGHLKEARALLRQAVESIKAQLPERDESNDDDSNDGDSAGEE